MRNGEALKLVYLAEIDFWRSADESRAMGQVTDSAHSTGLWIGISVSILKSLLVESEPAERTSERVYVGVLELFAQDFVDEAVVVSDEESLAGVTVKISGQRVRNGMSNGMDAPTHFHKITSWYRSGSDSNAKILYTKGLISAVVGSSCDRRDAGQHRRSEGTGEA